jgi:hypothetical protein
MRPTKLLDTNIREHCQSIHKRRYDALMVAIDAATSGETITVTGLGRHLGGTVSEKNRIKRIDLLIGNYNLYSDRFRLYQAMSYWLCSGTLRPILSVDWSTLTGDEKWHLLRASISFHGRAITICEMVFPQSDYGSPRSHQRFLDQLKQCLPEHCSPILVSDAGYKNPWFRAVEAMGWNWVGRVRGKVQVTRPDEDSWMTSSLLQHLIDVGPAYEMGQFKLAKSSPIECRMVAIRKPPKGRNKLTTKGQPARDTNSLAHARSQQEPWILATSLSELSAHQLVSIYSQRMQIEEAFRDTKSARFGLGLEFSGSRSLHRLSNLVLIAALTLFALMLIGICAENQNLHHKFQANTVRHYRVLSFITLALRVLDRMPEFCLSSDDLLYAQQAIGQYQTEIIS